MNEKSKLEIVSIFTAAYLIIFTIFAAVNKNYEFLYYIIIMGILIGIGILYHKKIHLTLHIIIGLSILGFMHISGGIFYFNGARLYDIYLIGKVLRYDNLVHSFGIFVSTFVVYNLLKPHLDKKLIHNKYLISLILILMAMGAGALNEVLELGAVVFLGAAEQVGDYFNNALDLIFNLIGSVIACFFIIYYHKKISRKK